jgi:hypothetical protein
MQHFEDSLNMHRIADKFVPLQLSKEQKDFVIMWQHFQERLERDQELCVTSFFSQN